MQGVDGMRRPPAPAPLDPPRSRLAVRAASAERPAGALRGAALLCGALLALGCTDDYTCPDPIGRIVRDDCEVYETRYEALEVELGVTFAGFGVGVGVGDKALRDPSELLQVLRLQTMALCRDYNACRVRPGEYRARREAMDARHAAIVALTEQLRVADDTATRRQLVASLVEVLRKPIAAPDEAPVDTGRRLAPFRDATHMWIGSRHEPPLPSLPPATPALAWWQPVEIRGVGGSTTRVFLTFRGTAAADDFAYAVLPDGTEARCAVTPRGPSKDDPERGPQARASCDFDRPAPPEAGRLRIDYRPGLTGQRHTLGHVPLDPAERLAEAWLAYLPSPVRLEPIDHERPWLVLFREERPDQNLTMRCHHEDQPVGGPIRAEHAMRRVGGLTRYHLPLPISLPRPGRVAETPAERSPPAVAGRWSCRISVLGRTVRTVDFRLDDAGRPVVAPPKGGVSPPWWSLAGGPGEPPSAGERFGPGPAP